MEGVFPQSAFVTSSISKRDRCDQPGTYGRFGRAPEKASVSLGFTVGPFPTEVYRCLDSRQREQAGLPGIM